MREWGARVAMISYHANRAELMFAALGVWTANGDLGASI
jgi:hypothetical protein